MWDHLYFESGLAESTFRDSCCQPCLCITPKRTVLPLSRLPPRLPKSIAFVIGPRTASSGEITPILFRGQAGVRYFGAPSAGYSTANTTIRLPNGGLLALTTAATVDRNGQAYEHELVPDVRTEEPIAQAAAWVTAQCRRTGSGARKS